MIAMDAVDLKSLSEEQLLDLLKQEEAKEVDAYQKFACGSAASRCGAYVRQFTDACIRKSEIKEELEMRKYGCKLPTLAETQARQNKVRVRLFEEYGKKPSFVILRAYAMAAEIPLSYFRMRTVEEAIAGLKQMAQTRKENILHDYQARSSNESGNKTQ